MDWKAYAIQGIELLFLGLGSYFDLKTREIPVSVLTIFGICGIVCNLLWKYQSIKEILLGCSIGLIVFFIGWVTKEAIGFGDALGLLILGLLEGWQGVMVIALIAFMLSAIYGFYKIIVFGENMRATMPFFPFLFLALLGVILI